MSSGGSGAGEIEELLRALDDVAAERIRDARTAKARLLSLIRAVRAAGACAGAAPVPVRRIAERLCYFANARDTTLRSGALRLARTLLQLPASAGGGGDVGSEAQAAGSRGTWTRRGM